MPELIDPAPNARKFMGLDFVVDGHKEAWEQLALFDAYQCCMECGWVFWTPMQLAQSFIDNAPDDVHVKTPAPNEIYFCPECLHDFAFTPTELTTYLEGDLV